MVNTSGHCALETEVQVLPPTPIIMLNNSVLTSVQEVLFDVNDAKNEKLFQLSPGSELPQEFESTYDWFEEQCKKLLDVDISLTAIIKHQNARHQELVCGVEKTSQIARSLCESGCWFQLTPMPDDHYEIEVKGDSAETLKNLVTHTTDDQ